MQQRKKSNLKLRLFVFTYVWFFFVTDICLIFGTYVWFLSFVQQGPGLLLTVKANFGPMLVKYSLNVIRNLLWVFDFVSVFNSGGAKNQPSTEDQPLYWFFFSSSGKSKWKWRSMILLSTDWLRMIDIEQKARWISTVSRPFLVWHPKLMSIFNEENINI